MDTTSDDAVAEHLAHFGVRGMKWGVRKNKPGAIRGASSINKKTQLVATTKLKSGGEISVHKDPPSGLSKLLSYRIPGYAKQASKNSFFTFKDKNGKSAGGGSAYKESKSSLYLDLLSVTSKERGPSHLSAAVKGLTKYAKDQGMKQVRVDVPVNDKPRAAVYKKLGFVPDGPTANAGAFGKIQTMKVEVDKVQHAQQSDEEWENEFAGEFAVFLSDNFGFDGGDVEHTDTVDDFLQHFGVKGMKWGQRLRDRKAAKNKSSADSAKSIQIRDTAKKATPKALTNAQLKTAIERMNLEQNFKRLAVNEKSGVSRWISSTLMEIGKREVQALAAKKVAGVIAKKVATGGVG